jgi:hypothetical protein
MVVSEIVEQDAYKGSLLEVLWRRAPARILVLREIRELRLTDKLPTLLTDDEVVKGHPWLASRSSAELLVRNGL